MIQDFSPIVQGDTGAKFAPQFVDANGPVDLSTRTISMSRQSVEPGSPLVPMTGTWTNDDPINGLAHFVYAAGDVAVPGAHLLWITLTDSGGKPAHADPQILEIRPLP